jgi:hypothetical protein
MKTILITVCFAAVVFIGCGRADSNTTKEDATVKTASGASLQAAVLSTNGTAYIRVKDYSTKSLKDTTPTGDEVKLQFGDAVKLIQKKDGPVIFWLVTKDRIQTWIPAYVLTANKAEVDFLKDNNVVPETMTFLSIDGGLRKAWGSVNMGFAVLLGCDGVPAPDPTEGTSPYAVKGNAVMFDESVTKAPWNQAPPVFDSAKRGFPLSPTCLYYCVSSGDNVAFQCIDLVTLKLRK